MVSLLSLKLFEPKIPENITTGGVYNLNNLPSERSLFLFLREFFAKRVVLFGLSSFDESIFFGARILGFLGHGGPSGQPPALAAIRGTIFAVSLVETGLFSV